MNLVVYDCEIRLAIANPREPRDPTLRYCAGWLDYAGMGISVICAYDFAKGYRVFMEDNFGEFVDLVQAEDTLLVGYNNHGFDDRLVTHTLGTRIDDRRSYDLYGAIRAACHNAKPAHGPSLDAVCRANFIQPKTGHGALAPALWQRGQYGQLIDYCLGDVLRTKQVLELVQAGRLRDAQTGRILDVKPPCAVPEVVT